jgi:tetratricopeptide (TPR) repeat protein
METLMKTIFVVTLFLLLTSNAFAQGVGDSVFVISKKSTVLKNENKVVGKASFGAGYKILKVNDDSFWVVRGDEKGWIKKNDVALPMKAIEIYTQYIEEALTSKNKSKWYRCRGATWYIKDKLDTAIKDFSEAIRLDSNNYTAYRSRGFIWDLKGDYNKAIKDHTKSIQLDPKDPLKYLNRGTARGKKGEYDKAIKDFTEANRLDPNNARAYHYRGKAWYYKREYGKAIKDFTEVIHFYPNYVNAYNDRAFAWSKKGEQNKAIKDFTEAIRLNPKYASAYNGRAWLYATCPNANFRNGEQAVKDATQACELTNWKNVRNLETLAAAYAENGDFENAIKWQQTAIDMATGVVIKTYHFNLELYKAGKPYRQKPVE